MNDILITFLCTIFILIYVYSISHFLWKLIQKKIDKHQMYWFWIIFLFPIIGSFFYLLFSKNLNHDRLGNEKEF